MIQADDQQAQELAELRARVAALERQASKPKPGVDQGLAQGHRRGDRRDRSAELRSRVRGQARRGRGRAAEVPRRLRARRGLCAELAW